MVARMLAHPPCRATPNPEPDTLGPVHESDANGTPNCPLHLGARLLVRSATRRRFWFTRGPPRRSRFVVVTAVEPRPSASGPNGRSHFRGAATALLAGRAGRASASQTGARRCACVLPARAALLRTIPASTKSRLGPAGRARTCPRLERTTGYRRCSTLRPRAWRPAPRLRCLVQLTAAARLPFRHHREDRSQGERLARPRDRPARGRLVAHAPEGQPPCPQSA